MTFNNCTLTDEDCSAAMAAAGLFASVGGASAKRNNCCRLCKASTAVPVQSILLAKKMLLDTAVVSCWSLSSSKTYKHCTACFAYSGCGIVDDGDNGGGAQPVAVTLCETSMAWGENKKLSLVRLRWLVAVVVVVLLLVLLLLLFPPAVVVLRAAVATDDDTPKASASASSRDTRSGGGGADRKPLRRLVAVVVVVVAVGRLSITMDTSSGSTHVLVASKASTGLLLPLW